MVGFRIQWHQLDHMQAICSSLQTDNHTNTSSIQFLLFLTSNQQCQSTEGNATLLTKHQKNITHEPNYTVSLCKLRKMYSVESFLLKINREDS